MQNAKLHIFSTKLYHFYVLTRKYNKILPFIYIVSKDQKGNTKSLNFFKKFPYSGKLNKSVKNGQRKKPL